MRDSRTLRRGVMTARRSAGLTALFPPGVEVFRFDGAETAPELMPGESLPGSGVLPRRRSEFARGRACARAGLHALGFGAPAVPVGPDRAPVWPAGVIGSITHCDGLVAAVVAQVEHFVGIGLDAEPRGPLESEIADRIATGEERALAAGSGPIPESELPRLLFSAKEVVHKCIHPRTQVMLGFLDVVVRFDHADRTFRVAAASDRARAVSELLRIEGRYGFDADHLMTGAVVRRD